MHFFLYLCYLFVILVYHLIFSEFIIIAIWSKHFKNNKEGLYFFLFSLKNQGFLKILNANEQFFYMPKTFGTTTMKTVCQIAWIPRGDRPRKRPGTPCSSLIVVQ